MSYYEVATDYRSFGASETYYGQRWSDGGKATANFDRVDEGFEGFLDDGKAFGAHLFISRANLVKPWKFCLTPAILSALIGEVCRNVLRSCARRRGRN